MLLLLPLPLSLPHSCLPVYACPAGHQVRTRNIEAVNKMDAMASQALQRYDTVKTIDASNSNEMRGLMALMGSTKI